MHGRNMEGKGAKPLSSIVGRHLLMSKIKMNGKHSSTLFQVMEVNTKIFNRV